MGRTSKRLDLASVKKQKKTKKTKKKLSFKRLVGEFSNLAENDLVPPYPRPHPPGSLSTRPSVDLTGDQKSYLLNGLTDVKTLGPRLGEKKQKKTKKKTIF